MTVYDCTETIHIADGNTSNTAFMNLNTAISAPCSINRHYSLYRTLNTQDDVVTRMVIVLHERLRCSTSLS